MNSIVEKLGVIPDKPGVYVMKDSSSAVLYVGKAKNLKKRVQNYFGKGKDSRNSVLLFVPKVSDIEWFITDNEKEAFLLENNLIKKLKPRYNISLKDDKDFLSIRIDPKEDFPRLSFVRRPKSDGALYFGPYSQASSIKLTLRSIGKIFPLRRCSDHLFRNRSRPCVLYQIELCTAPCVEFISKEEYAKIVNQAVNFLKGRSKEIVLGIESEMKKASNEMRYEDAAKLRNKIRAVNSALLEQKVVSKDLKDRDIFGFAREGEQLVVSLLTMRLGKLVGGKNFKLKSKYLKDSEVFSSFLSQYYLNKASFVPKEILAPMSVLDKRFLEEGFIKNEGIHPKIIVPQRGESFKLVKMACKNAKENLKAVVSRQFEMGKLLELARIKLRLKQIPARIEGYDISNLSGGNAAGSMVVFLNGLPDKNFYRKFKIRLSETPDDYLMMSELLIRRLSNEDLGLIPNLIVIDGGKGQLNIADSILKEKSYEHIDLVSIAKERSKEGKRVYDRIFIKGRKNPLSLKPDSPILHLIARVRDEAHRFALAYHKKLRAIV